VDQVRHLILSGRLKPGTLLPSVRQLAADLTVSVITTRRAYEELEREELIVTRPGAGSIVAEGGTGGHAAARRAYVRSLLTESLAEARKAGMSSTQIKAMVEEILHGLSQSETKMND
jgi:GntR family transcriptional regulator